MGLIDYVGDWHKHPGCFDTPSAQDRQTARHIVTDAEWDQLEAVFPIAVVDGDHIRMRAYLMYRYRDDFAEVPIEIVPDTDPRVLSVLAGDEGGRGRS